MRVHQRNAILQKALGIASIEFKFYRADRAQWRVILEDGEQFSVSTHHFGSESTVLRLAAAELAKRGRPVSYK